MDLTKGKIVENVCTALVISKKESAGLVESFFDIIKEELSNGNDVMISGFGKWTVKSKNQRKIRDFRTGEENILAARKIVKFKPSGKLRDTVNTGGWLTSMADKLDPEELMSLKDMLLSEVITSEAIINLLDRKNIISKQELLEEMKRVQASILKAGK
jgi:integration host factor subunit alpha